MIISNLEFIDYSNDTNIVIYYSNYCNLINNVLLDYILLNNKTVSGYALGLFYYSNDTSYFTKDFYFKDSN